MTDMTGTPRTTSPPRVLVGFDGSETAWRALDRAADEAALREAPLEILCGWPWDKYHEEESGQGTLFQRSRQMVERAAERMRQRHPGMRVIPSITAEAAAAALVRCGHEAALTVLGTRGHGGFAGLLLGSVSLRVAAHTTSPLLVVRGEAENVERGNGRVLIGLESDADQEALRYAFEEAQRHKAELQVVHVYQVYPYPTGVADADSAEAVVQHAVAGLREEYPDVRVRTEPVGGDAGHQLVQQSESADVLVIAAHRSKFRLGLQLGPVTHAVLHHAKCPVVLIPTE